MLNRVMNISLLEGDIAWGDKETNIATLKKRITQIPKGTDIVVLPEFFTTGFMTENKDTILSLAEKNTDNTISELQKLAKEHGVAIAGSFIAKTASRIYNRGFIIEPTGDETYYDKRHLFSMAKEDAVFTRGNSLPMVLRYRGWNIMLIICYDLRFPEWFRNLDNKYDMLIVVANWPRVREYAWRQLLIARALENGCYVCGVNRTGIDNHGIEYSGSSMVVDYKGQIIASNTPVNAGKIINAALDLKALKEFRKKFPAWKDADKYNFLSIYSDFTE